MRSRFASGVCGAVVLLAVIAACGGSEGSPGGEKQAFIDQVDPLCENAIKQVDAIGDGTDTATLQKANQVWTDLHQQVKAKPLPNESFDLGSTFVAALYNVSASSEDAYQSSLANNQTNLQNALNNLATNKKTASDAAERYGFKDCDNLDRAAEDEGDQDEDE